MKNKANLSFAILVLLFPILACSKIAEIGKNLSNVRSEEPKSTSTTDNAEWKTYSLDKTDISIDLPGEPVDKSPSESQIPPSYKEVFSEMHSYALDRPTFGISAAELVPTKKHQFTIRQLADTSMIVYKRQVPDLKYTLEINSANKAVLKGSFSKNGKNYDLRGCCLYKKSDPSRVWALITLYHNDNAEARAIAERAIASVVFEGAPEECK